MDIKESLLTEHSKMQVERVANYVGRNPVRFAELLELFLGDDYRVTQRAAWAMSYCVDRYPALLKPHLERVIRNLRNEVHVAVRRNTIRVLQNVDIPEALLGEATDICFQYLVSHDEPVAVKVFAMTVLWNISQCEPDLMNELKLLIEEQMPYGTPGFKSRGKKILKGIADFRRRDK